jgi:DNA invertase Pin-like site-specific DNA recombinase
VRRPTDTRLTAGDAPLSCAIYNRVSIDNHLSRSIDDQERVCRAWAEREGWTVTEVYADYAISGATSARPQFQQLIADARRGRFQIVLAEALDRISRDQEHVAHFYKQCQFARVRVVTLAEGEISELHVGLRGTMSALFLKDLAQKTHRGLEGRVRAGGSAGGLSYGYRIRRGLRPDGNPITGEMEIDPEEAKIVRQSFGAYANGQSPRAIARNLNTAGVPGPRGGKWSASLLLGGAERETGLLRNRLYVGERVWNRQHWVKDPETGKRLARLNPREAWITNPVADLAIIDRELWDQVQARLNASRRVVTETVSDSGSLGGRLAAVRRPKWPLSGLVRCGVCEGPMSVVGSGGRLGCANHVERGTCDNRRTVARDRLVERVLIGLKEGLLAPELVEAFVEGYVEEVNTANRERGARQASLRSQASKLDRQIRNLLELIKEGHGTAAMAAEMREIEARKATLEAEIVGTADPEPMPILHPNLPALYRRRVEALEEALTDPQTAGPATEALRVLINAIVVFPGERRGEVSVTLRGDLAAFLHADEAERARGAGNKKAALREQNGCSWEVLATLDAGTGFEPVTFRL